MDRSKSILAKRGPKVKTLPPPGDFIALGSKSNRQTSIEAVETKLIVSKPAHGLHIQHAGPSSDRKRPGEVPAAASSIGLAAKKPKLAISTTPSGLLDVQSGVKKDKDGKKGDHWLTIAVEVASSDLMGQISEAEDGGNYERVEALLCGAVKSLGTTRAKPEPSRYLTLMYLAKSRPSIFFMENVVESFCSLLKRDVSLNFKAKGNALVSVLAANILMISYQDEKRWPDVFVKVYLEDALGERVWVDHEDCKGFVENIQTAFNTKMPPKSMLLPDFGFKPDACPSPPAATTPDDDDTTESATSTESRDKLDVPVLPRYTHVQEQVEKHVMEILHSRRPMDNISRNIMRVLTSTCGLSEVRLMVSQRLEMWLQNPKLMRPAQDLLLTVCLNCNQLNQHDVEVISHLVKIRLKSKPLVNHYIVCIKELLSQHPENLSTVLKHTIYNELSNSRNPNNMTLLQTMFVHSPEQAAMFLSEVFQDLLMNKDDYLRALRALFREIVRALKYDINFGAFCLGLMQERKDALFREADPQVKERMFASIADMITLSVFMGITPAVRDAASACMRGDRRDINVLRAYQQQAATIERDAVWWLHVTVPRMFKPVRAEYTHCLQKVLFLEPLEQYHNKDNWPPEGDRHLMFRVASEMPILEDTLMRLLIIGLSKDHPINAPETHEVVDLLVKRAAGLYMEDFQVIQVEKIDPIELLFNLCAYHHPENYTLPDGYQPPNVAIASLYWKTWILLLIMTAHNPATFGYLAWENYPTLRSFIEMCITNHFNFPPPTLAAGERADEIKSEELQISHKEKQVILEFENHLASTVVTENASLLLSQLISMDPSGMARKPPPQILEQLKMLNQTLKLGHLLCRSRNPDFLLEIIQRQGTSQSMPWLADLVESTEGAFNMLPVQCLCEFLLNEPLDARGSAESDKEDWKEGKEESKLEKIEKAKRKEKKRKQQLLLQHLQGLLRESGDDPRPTLEVLDYFMRRLASQQSSARAQATRGLTMVLSSSEEEDMQVDAEIFEHRWLLKHLPILPHFEVIRGAASLALRQACQIETNPWTVSSYIQFLSCHAPDEQIQDSADLALNMAQLIVERTTILNYILPSESGLKQEQKSITLAALMNIFLKYIRRAREPLKEAYSWSECQDQIIVQWATGEAATMHILVAHAMVILLTYGRPEDSSMFDELLEIWFPVDCEPPQAFLVDTSEEALLLPDWLKLRMIRSTEEALVNAALHDLEPTQLVLFIQSFGIPVPNVSKLLHVLDLAAEFHSYAVEQAVVDKSYMSQLVEVQQQREATGGQRFAQLLEEGTPTPQDENEMGYTGYDAKMQSPLVIPPKPDPLVQLEALPSSLVYLLQLDPKYWPSVKEQQEISRSLQKALATEASSTNKPLIASTLKLLDELVSSREGFRAVESMHRVISLSCPLFRLLQSSMQSKSNDGGIIRNSILENQLVGLSKKILDFSVGAKSTPLTNMLQQIVNPAARGKAGLHKCLAKRESELSFTHQLTEEQIIKAITDAERQNPSQLESVVRQLMLDGMKWKNSKTLATAVTKLLVQQPNDKTSTASLFVDWLEALDPEIIKCAPELQQQLLFVRQQAPDLSDKDRPPSRSSDNPSSQGARTFRPYLLALLTHQASWETLHECISMILQDAKISGHDASAVLDFLWACVYIPKVWQGRDKRIPKHYIPENLLGLSIPQVTCVTNYLLEEARLVDKKSKPTDVDANLSAVNVNEAPSTSVLEGPSPQVVKLLEMRIPLLLHCTCDHQDILQAVVEHLLTIIESNSANSSAASCLLQQMYMQVPLLISWISNTEKFLTAANITQMSSSRLDTISHTLLTALACTEATKDWSDKIQDIDLACRKMAASHPILLLRQLSMLASSLRGRTQLDFHVFKLQHHMQYFTCVMGLLELLQPHIFQMEFSSALEDTLESYFDLLVTHGLQFKELRLLINRFLGLLHNFMAHDTQRAVRYIQKHSSALHELSGVQPDMNNLRSLLAGISLPRQVGDAGGPAVEEELTPSLSYTPQSTPAPATGHGLTNLAHVQAQLGPLLNKLTHAENSEEIVTCLQELDVKSLRKIHILEYFTDELKRFILDTNETSRSIAHNLVIRHMKQDPRCSTKYLSGFLACLDSDHQEVIMSALDKLGEFVLLSQENASTLLQKAFSVGISTSINTLPYITETMMLLNMQSGS